MIFAAGKGTRMGDLTRDRPKPLVEIAGKPMIDHAIDMALEIGPRRIVVNTHYLAELLEAHLAPFARLGVAVAREAPDLLETGGGLRAALPLLDPGDGPVLTANSDALWIGPNPLDLAARAWNPSRMDALLVCVPLDRAPGRSGPGDVALGADGRLGFGGDHVFGGVQAMNPARLADIPERIFSLSGLWRALAAEGRLYGLEYPGHACDLGHPAGLARTEEILASGPFRSP